MLSKLSDTTLKLWNKVFILTFFFNSESPPIDLYSPLDRNQFSTYIALRVDLHDHFLNIAPLFAPVWFADSFFALFDFFMLFSNSIWNLFLHFFFHFVNTMSLKLCKSM